MYRCNKKGESLAAVDITNPQTWNRYAYVMNNPLNSTDPLGLKCGVFGGQPIGCGSFSDGGWSGGDFGDFSGAFSGIWGGGGWGGGGGPCGWFCSPSSLIGNIGTLSQTLQQSMTTYFGSIPWRVAGVSRCSRPGRMTWKCVEAVVSNHSFTFLAHSFTRTKSSQMVYRRSDPRSRNPARPGARIIKGRPFRSRLWLLCEAVSQAWRKEHPFIMRAPLIPAFGMSGTDRRLPHIRKSRMCGAPAPDAIISDSSDSGTCTFVILTESARVLRW